MGLVFVLDRSRDLVLRKGLELLDSDCNGSLRILGLLPIGRLVPAKHCDLCGDFMSFIFEDSADDDLRNVALQIPVAL